MIDNYKIEYTFKAKHDLEDIYTYIEKEFKYIDYAKNTIKCIKDFIDSLKIVPKRFSEYNVGIWKNKGYRKGIIKNYAVFFRVDDKNLIVEIDRIVYSSREYI